MPQFNAKLKNKSHVKIFSSNEELRSIDFYTIPNIDNEVEYNCITHQASEHDERLFVTLSDTQTNEMMWEYQRNITASGEINTISRAHYNDIDVLYLANNNEYIFTKIWKSYLVRATTILWYWDLWPEIKQQEAWIEFDGQVDVYFNNETKKLYFKNFTKAKSIFKWLISFYRIANSSEVNSFLDNWFFDIGPDFQKAKIWENILKNIAQIIDTSQINFSDNTIRHQYNLYAREFECEIDITTDGKFKIQKNANLTSIVKLLQWRYYKDYINPTKKMEAINTKPLS